MSIKKTSFGKLPCGKEVDCYIMKNASGAELHVLNYGLRVQTLLVPDKNGKLTDVVLGYDSIDNYLGADYQGAFVGRYANRIGDATFSIGNETYVLDKNDNENSLHGGPTGYHQHLWNVQSINDGDEPKMTFMHTSPDGHEGFPGNLELEITYTLTKTNEVVFEYSAKTDKATPFNPTNHSFFNLSGDHNKEVDEVFLTINSTKSTEVAENLIPNGNIVSIAGTVLDFSKGKKIGQDIHSTEKVVAMCQGFDHNYCVDGESFRTMAKAFDQTTGISMEVLSDMPGIQLYTFNGGNGNTGKKGAIMGDHTAFCLETQFYPDSVNKPSFPYSPVTPSAPFYSKTVYKFSN
ncbi:MAG: aldose epimerase family protein [Clostridia bacterium]